ncbi:amidohydrolase family protein [Actinokineospora soli]
MTVDAHVHLWDPATRPYPWMRGPALDPIRRPYTVADYAEAATPDVTAAILVQTVSTVEETLEFLGVARAGGAAAVVGWADLTALDLPDDPLLVGIRHQVEDEPDPDWLLRPDVRRGLVELGDRGLVYDLLVRAPGRPAALAAARSCSDTAFVLDHAGKPAIADGEWDTWAAWITDLATCPNVSCKLSGLVTEARWDSWRVEDIAPYAAHVLDAFGADRVLFGSDWPVCDLAGGYERVRALLDHVLATASAAERDAVLGGTARRVYRL